MKVFGAADHVENECTYNGKACRLACREMQHLVRYKEEPETKRKT